METTTLVFSKNRACQLDLFLYSFFKNFDIGTVNIVVKATDAKYGEGYYKLQKKYSQVNFITETKSIREHFFDSLHKGVICLSTDDTVFHKKAPFDKDDVAWIFDGDVLSFHPRLGKNAVLQDYRTGRLQKVFPKWLQEDWLLTWNYIEGPTQNNWFYPFELDGMLIQCKDLDRIAQFDWQTLRSLEGGLSHARRSEMYYKPFMSSPVESFCFNIPVNSVQDNVLYHSDKCHVSEEELNNRWLDGDELSLEKMDTSNIIGAHMEIPLEWK